MTQPEREQKNRTGDPAQLDAVPHGVDPNTANVARMYDHYLGGKDNYSADREAAEKALAAVPEGRTEVLQNREFLRRVVRYWVGECGIRQILDIGAGLPTVDNTHEVAHRVEPSTRIVYVDHDPVVLAHARALLANGSDNVAVVQADLRAPTKILDDPATQELIDPSQPLGVLLVAILHFITEEEDPAGLVAQLRDALAPGSYLALSHVNPSRPGDAARVEAVYRQANRPVKFRGREQIAKFFDGFELIEPGIVHVAEWRPDLLDPDIDRQDGYGLSWILGGVGRVPEVGRASGRG